jgi:hypothetical protein
VTAETRTTETDGRPNDGRARDEETPGVVFRYGLLDMAGRDVGVIRRRVPLRADDTIVLEADERWRVVAVLGTSATVART